MNTTACVRFDTVTYYVNIPYGDISFFYLFISIRYVNNMA